MEGTPQHTTPPVAADAEGRRWVGMALLGVSVLAFGLQNNLSKLTYDYGVSVVTLLTARTWLIVGALAVWLAVTHRSPRVAPGLWPRLLWISLLFAGGAFALLSAIEMIPVSLAILAFYTFPVFVALLSAALGDEPLSLVTLVGLGIAFVGLALALDVSAGGNLYWGVGAALAAALAMTFNIVGSRQLMQRVSGPVISFNMFAVAAVLLTGAVMVDGGPRLPGGGEGWLVFGGATALAMVSLVCLYLALEFVTGTRAALVLNGEPVLTVLFAVLLFAEPFTPVQTLGAALVVGAIVAVTLAGRRRPA